MKVRNVCLFLLIMVSGPVLAQKSYPPRIEGATEHIYKKIDGVELKLWEISNNSVGEKRRPAIIFFFGGGWRSGSPTQFAPQAKALAGRGMITFLADYRVSSRHGTVAKDCVADARDAIRFVRENAETLGVDPERIAAGGGSAGGHIAACLGVMEEDAASSIQAMALFNPACVLAPIEGEPPWADDRVEELRKRMGIDPKELSPAHHVSDKAAPCIIFHGKADTKVPFTTAMVFTEKMKQAGVECRLHAYEREGHGFFNFGRKPQNDGKSAYEMTLGQLDQFLVELGWIGAK